MSVEETEPTMTICTEGKRVSAVKTEMKRSPDAEGELRVLY